MNIAPRDKGRLKGQRAENLVSINLPSCRMMALNYNLDISDLSLSAQAIALRDRLAKIRALHASWRVKDKKAVLQDEELVACQRQRCRKIGLEIFGFTLQEAQIDAFCTFFYEVRDFLLLAKTGFGKSLIYCCMLYPLWLHRMQLVMRYQAHRTGQLASYVEPCDHFEIS